MRYRLNLPIMTLAHRDNHLAAVSLPAGTEVEVVGPDRDDRFLVVKVRNEELLMFATDLDDRARPATKHTTRTHAVASDAGTR